MYEESTQRIINLMKRTFGEAGPDGTFKIYYDGDPDQIQTFNLPCLVVDQTNDETSEGAIGQDDVVDSIIIKVIFNKADDYEQGVNPNDLTSRKIRRIIAARDPETGHYMENTIKHAVRHASTEGLTAIAGDMSIEYGLVPRLNSSSDGDEGLWMQEGHVRFTIRYSVDEDQLP